MKTGGGNRETCAESRAKRSIIKGTFGPILREGHRIQKVAQRKKVWGRSRETGEKDPNFKKRGGRSFWGGV